MIRDINTYPFKGGERLLLDTNVWLYTYGPISYTRQEGAGDYSRALAKLSNNKCEIYICPIVISEFINKCINGELILNGIPFEARKAFQRLSNFVPIAKKISIYMQDILSFTKCCDSSFDAQKADFYLKDFQKCKLDYNDVIIEDVCIQNRLILVTNDGDFKDSRIPVVLTANPDLVT